MAFQRILVPFDSSSYSKKAFERALGMAKNFNGKIFLLTIVQGPYMGKPYKTGFSKKSASSEKERVKKIVSKMSKQAEKNGVDYKSDIKYSESVIEGILNYADSKKIQLIIMGSRGKTGFKKLLLGSVSSGVSQHAKCTVMIVK
ncbi:MAG: universal stress protein [Nitrosopumilaceae archaeon]|nr:universal stress protein [Nitrosopumilaceae archaeon]NIU00063.1 universal stress protein [Nitrosopumilaceae archaeon]NIU86442.1 universal stress protein [Nitrosopumilaceae archaeon]NIV65151.1 universal stress protein [Nitrosopumilaceae archaeon]NIX60665.1 universal stress protein [Nitrosopumilaceae archaeon]